MIRANVLPKDEQLRAEGLLAVSLEERFGPLLENQPHEDEGILDTCGSDCARHAAGIA